MLRITILPLDLCDENSIENLAKEIFSRDTFIDILVISAGIIENLSPVDSIDLDKISKVIKLNFLSSFRIIKNFHPLLRNSIEGKLAVVSSVKNNSKNQYWGIYQPIMSALNELVMTYANENINTQIKVNLFCPEAVDTNFREKIMPGENKKGINSAQYVAQKIVNNILITKYGKIDRN